jgi:hypothetical protein
MMSSSSPDQLSHKCASQSPQSIYLHSDWPLCASEADVAVKNIIAHARKTSCKENGQAFELNTFGLIFDSLLAHDIRQSKNIQVANGRSVI